MIISRLRLRDYGRFEDFAAEFAPGINLIKGPNEAGKSTLASAVTTALFADPAKDLMEVAAAVKWGDSKAPSLEAILDVDGAKFKLTKDFGKGTSVIEPQNIGMPGGETYDIGSWLSERLGMPSGEVFRSTACIRQGEIDRIDDSIEAIKDKLESLATAGKEEEAASWTMKKINDRLEQLRGQSGGESELLQLQKELEYNIEKLERDIETLRGKRADLIQVETAYTNVREDLKERTRNLESAKQAREVADKAAEITNEINRLRGQIAEAEELHQKIDKLNSQRTSLKRVRREELTEMEQIESSMGHLQPKCFELEEETAEAEEDLNSYKVGPLGIMMTVIGAIGGGLFALNYFTDILQTYLPEEMQVILPQMYNILVGSASLFLLGISLVISRRQHRAYLAKKHAKLQSKLTTLKGEVEIRQNTLKSKLASFGSTSVDDLKKNQWQYEIVEKELEGERVRYNEIVAGNSLDQLKERLGILEGQEKSISPDNDELARYLVSPADLERQRLVVSEIGDRIKDLEKERSGLIQQIELAEGGSELLASYQERRERLGGNDDNHEHEIKILELTVRCIEEARQNVLVSKLEILNNRASEILDGLTGGRYPKVRFDKSNLKFEVWSMDKSDWIDPERWLSTGTMDQIYLAARLALSDLVSGEKNSILILDDPFASYDEARLGNAMKVLKDLSDNHQILLMTSHDYYDKWADSVITLNQA